MGERRPTAVLISGRGSNLQALIEGTARPVSSARIVLVLSDQEAPGLAHARAAGIEAATVDRRAFERREAFERVLDRRLRDAGAELICLAGFMRILSPRFVDRWRERILNVHPSLLPAFPGLDTHRRALDAGVRIHGCTVHLVRAEVDCGPIIVQGAVPVLPDDTPDVLAARVLEVEHRIYPYALDLLAAGRVRVEGDRAVIDSPPGSLDPMLNPPPVC
ncbi:MAG: phosphoribosylglycinamide formyltransferase [Geminicoccaceae bacterium]|nr:phosphoribosylglycinamide formyltransferase [Geminicoccaceae bacterium]